MLRRDQQLRTQVLQIKDALLFTLGLWLAHFFRTLWKIDLLQTAHPVEPFQDFVWLYLIILPGAPLLLETQGFYQRAALGSRRMTIWILLKSCALMTLGVVLVMFLFKLALARSVIVLFGLVSFLLVLASEEFLRHYYRTRFGQRLLTKRVILVGSKEDIEKTRDDLKTRAPNGLEIVGELDISNGSLDRLATLLHERSPNGVILTAKHIFFGQIEKAIQVCEIEGVEVWLWADFFQTQISHTTFDDFHGRPVLVFRSAPEASWQGVAKQVLDIVGAAILLGICGLPMLICAVLIRISSPGPILFRQQRCGLNGEPFTMLKFRTMATDAEQRKQELAALNEMTGPVFKVTNDPRVTPVGRWLRRWSFDELPQLLNVLRGEMSLVGPRPLPVDEVERFDDPAHRRRLSVKPGLTCLWQVSGRNNVRDFKEWVRLDLEYIDNWSFWLDLKILWRTLPAVVSGAGAK